MSEDHTHSPEPGLSGCQRVIRSRRIRGNQVHRDQTLLEELVWSVALIGGVVAYLDLVVQFAS